MRVNRSCGFTLIEFVLATLTLVVAATAILGAYVGQVTLNEHARNLSLAIQDASRVIEQLRVRNTTPCVGDSVGAGNEPTAMFPAGAGVSWDTWLDTQPAGGRSLLDPFGRNVQFERIVVTCQDNATLVQCGTTGDPTAQVGANESTLHPGGDTNFDPIRVTVAVCWRHRNRNIGQCSGTGPLTPDDSVPFPNNTPNVIESPAMLTTIITCRSQ